jgi:hypothetical protein
MASIDPVRQFLPEPDIANGLIEQCDESSYNRMVKNLQRPHSKTFHTARRKLTHHDNVGSYEEQQGLSIHGPSRHL